VLKRKLLLADDSITIQKVVNLTFADEGIEVISVGDGDAAMEKINESAPNLVLADVNMPGLSGYQICERLKSNAATQSIPVILLVGSFEPFDEAEAYRVGADDYLTKPFQSIRQLVSKVSDLLESASGAETPAAGDAVSTSDEGELSDLHFMDTKEFPRQSATSSDQLGDAGMDDEMIQTNQVGSLPVDETQKYMSEAQAEEETRATDENLINEPIYADFEAHGNLEIKNDSGLTQPSSEEDLQLLPSEEIEKSGGAMVYNFADESARSNQQTGQNQAMSTGKIPEIEEFSDETKPQSERRESSTAQNEKFFGGASQPPAAASNSMFDDMDLLELPSYKPRVSFGGSAAGTQTARTSEPAILETGEKSVNATERVNQFSRLSPEMIEALAQKVAEKISDKMIREIAWELVPQLTATLMKRMSEEKLKE
jgi:DNA-binding response OmpR family regulator